MRKLPSLPSLLPPPILSSLRPSPDPLHLRSSLSPSSSFSKPSFQETGNLNDSLEDVSSISEDSRSIECSRRRLQRSLTFTSDGTKVRRKLPCIPVRGSIFKPDQSFPDHRSSSSDHYDPGFFSLSDERSSEVDSGSPPLELYGEETCVDAPLLPKRNSSNYLWVEFENPDEVVRRRPKNHDRLSQGRNAKHRHSAPPGMLDNYPRIRQKRSLPEKPGLDDNRIGSKYSIQD